MAAGSMINLKVFLRENTTTDTRRFTVDASVVTNFMFMKEKLQTVFPTLHETVFKITWKDADGDEITIASDEDFITAFTEMNSSVKSLYVTVVRRNHEPIFMAEDAAQNTHFQGPRVICDVCNQLIDGFRYKCLQCMDYDLCAGCEHQGHHTDHIMIRVPNNNTLMPRCARKAMHHVAKTLKKSASAASKEAYRAAKFASRFAPAGKSTEEENKGEQPQSQAQPGSSNQVPEEQQGCPFATGEAFNMNDIHALGAMARQHLGPLLDVLQTPPQTAATNAEQGGLFLDMIRNAVDGFFGRIPENVSSQPQEQSAEKEPSTQNRGNEGNTPASNNQPSNMDVDDAAAEAKSNNTADCSREPGWIDLTAPTEAESTENENSQSNHQPTAPVSAVFVHDNPLISAGLVRLHEMGFSNTGGYLTRLLEHYHGDVSAVVKTILETKNVL